MSDEKTKTIRVSWENSSAIGTDGEEFIEVPAHWTEEQIEQAAEDTVWACSGWSWGYSEVDDE